MLIGFSDEDGQNDQIHLALDLIFMSLDNMDLCVKERTGWISLRGRIQGSSGAIFLKELSYLC